MQVSKIKIFKIFLIFKNWQKDFGLSQVQGILYKKTPLYQRIKPPETKGDRAFFTTKSDVYMFGLIMFELFTNQLPRLPENYTSMEHFLIDFLSSQKGNSYFSTQKVRGEYINLIVNCATENPDSRPSFEELVEKLEQIRFMDDTNRTSERSELLYPIRIQSSVSNSNAPIGTYLDENEYIDNE